MKRPQKTVFLIFVISVIAVAFEGYAQAETQTQAYLVDSFGLLPNGDFKGRADVFMHEVTSRPASLGLIVIYGPPRQVEARKRLSMSHFTFRRFPTSRLRYKVGGNVSEFRTEFWLIPTGATQPELKPEAWIFREIGRAYKADVTKGMSDLDKEAWKLGDHQAYIINYGSPAQIAQRERWIRDAIVFRRFDSYRIKLVNGGSGPVRTVMWLVPLGAENPKP